MSKVHVVGVAGRAGAGKDPAAQAVVGYATDYCKPYALAKGLKDMQAAFYGIHPDDPLLYTPEGKASLSPRPMKLGNTVRDDLMDLGDATRAINPDIWVEHTLHRIETDQVAIAVISDVRYPNELKACDTTIWIGDATPGKHATEAALMPADVDGPVFDQPTVAERLYAVRAWANDYFAIIH